MQDAAAALSSLWDRFARLAAQIEPGDWAKPTPCPGWDVRDVVSHVARVSGGDAPPARLLDALRLARTEQGARGSGLMPGPAGSQAAGIQRLLGAWCLDMYVHAHDLAGALDQEPEVDPAAAAEACRYLLRLTPQLLRNQLAAAGGAAARLVEGRVRWSPIGDRISDLVTADPGTFVLLLCGRGDPQRFRAEGTLEWSGGAGAAFVEKARLYAP